MMYLLTPEEHAQAVNALNIGIAKHYDLAEDGRIGNALAMLKAMKPVEPCAKLKPCSEDWFVDLDNAPPFTGETVPLYAKEQQ